MVFLQKEIYYNCSFSFYTRSQRTIASLLVPQKIDLEIRFSEITGILSWLETKARNIIDVAFSYGTYDDRITGCVVKPRIGVWEMHTQLVADFKGLVPKLQEIASVLSRQSKR